MMEQLESLRRSSRRLQLAYAASEEEEALLNAAAALQELPSEQEEAMQELPSEREEALINPAPAVEDSSSEQEEELLDAEAEVPDSSSEQEEDLLDAEAEVPDSSSEQEEELLDAEAAMEDSSSEQEEELLDAEAAMEDSTSEQEEELLDAEAAMEDSTNELEVELFNAVAALQELPSEREEALINPAPAVEESSSEQEDALLNVAATVQNVASQQPYEVLDSDDDDTALPQLSTAASTSQSILNSEVTAAYKRRRCDSADAAATPSTSGSMRDASTSPLYAVSRYIGVDEDDDDGMMCNICMDDWEMTGPHRLTSLKCGHLFGEACIKRWLTCNMRNCPQCKADASPNDTRYIYAKRVRLLDRSEELKLQQQLYHEREQSSTLHVKLKSMRRSYDEINNENAVLHHTIDRLSSEVRQARTMAQAALLSANAEHDRYLAAQREIPLYKLRMETELVVQPEPGCRSMLYVANKDSLLCSCKSLLFPGYALRYVDFPTYRTKTTFWMSAKIIRDITMNKDETQLGVVSMEPCVKLFDMRTSQLSTNLSNLRVNLWSCTMDKVNHLNVIYLGTQNGKTYVYDMRMPTESLQQLRTDGDLSPVIGIEPYPPTADMPFGGVIVCKLQSIWFFEYTSNSGKDFVAHKMKCCGPFLSMKFDNERQNLLIQTRRNIREDKSKFLLGRIKRVVDTPVIVPECTFEGSSLTTHMTRATQINVKDNVLVAGFLQDSDIVAVYDEYRMQRIQSIPVHGVVYDMTPVYRNNEIFLATLSDSKCRVFKVNEAN